MIFEALHHVLQFLRNGKPHPRCALDDGDSLIRDIEEDHGRAQDATASEDVGIEDIRHAHKGEDADSLANPLKADGAGQLLLHDGTEDSCDAVRYHKRDECIEQIVEAAKELPDDNADARRIQTYR